tara:strand:+ start:42 stop:1286 length:1245 start_codon:yes stop_codon:yes gene_type:complete
MVMRLLDLFSGIGGFSYAAEKLVGGYETVAFCEQDEFCQKVLRKHWKDVPIYDDVRTIDAARLGRIDIVAGGFPCQAVSQAGLQKATEDDRWLWDEMLRIIQDCKPRWVIGENVVGLININEGVLFEQVQTDLEKEGYSVQSVVIPACAKNAPHRRDRVWIIGNYRGDKFMANSICDQHREEVRRESEQEKEIQIKLWETDSSTRKPSRASDIWKTSNKYVSNTESEGLAHSNEREICIPKQTGLDSNQKGNRGKIWSKSTRRNKLSTEDVANTEGINRYDNEIVRKHGEVKTQRILRNRDSISNTQGQNNVSNSNSQRGCSRETRRKDAKNVGERSKSQKHRSGNTISEVGDLADGISRGLLRHFDREPEHIPRVTTGEKDRAKKLKALGNSIVPQVVAEIFNAIKVAEHGEQ